MYELRDLLFWQALSGSQKCAVKKHPVEEEMLEPAFHSYLSELLVTDCQPLLALLHE